MRQKKNNVTYYVGKRKTTRETYQRYRKETRQSYQLTPNVGKH